jgi:hypothetical protein
MHGLFVMSFNQVDPKPQLLKGRRLLLVLVLVEVSPSRRLGACWRRCCWMRTAFSSRGPSQLFFGSSMLCSVSSWVVFHPIFCIRLFPLVFQQSFELLDIFCLPGFSGQLVPWLCHSHTETVSSHLCPCILVDQV